VTARDRIVIMVVLALGAVAAGWMLVVSPKRDQAASLSTQITAQQTQLDTARSQLSAGQTARAAFAGQYAQLAKLGEAVPPDDDVPSLIYQVQNAAHGAKVSFRGLQLSNAPGGSSTAPSPSSSPTSSSGSGSGSSSSSSSSSSSGSGSSSSSAAGASSATTSGSQLPPGAAVGAAGLPTEQFTFSLTGNFFHLADFFNRLQSFVTSRGRTLLISGRLMTINGINLAPAASGFPQITASISATTYIVPASEGTFGGATPAGPAGAPQASTSPSSSSTGGPAAAITSPLR
jgi:type II secretory pathway pseudopilin PulG